MLRINPIFIDNVISNKIDRTFVDQDGTRWIIDYKTSRHEEEEVDAFLDQQQDRYKEQLEKYGASMKLQDDIHGRIRAERGQEPGTARTIRLGLYFPLLQGWLEWEYNR